MITVFSLCLLSTYAYSFETGVYHGESANHRQVCDLNIVQNVNSISINQFECHDLDTTMSTSLDPSTYDFGHFEQSDPSQGLALTADISEDGMTYVVRSLSSSESMNESLKVAGKGTVHFNLQASDGNTSTTYFDLNLTKK